MYKSGLTAIKSLGSLPHSGDHRGIQPPELQVIAESCVSVCLIGFRPRPILLREHCFGTSQGEAIHMTDNESSSLTRCPFPVVI